MPLRAGIGMPPYGKFGSIEAGCRIDGGGLIDLSLSRQDLAEGTTLYTISRILSGWERRVWFKHSLFLVCFCLFY
jgi:hypothetical protein